jgi:hypothetical protein
MEQTLKSYVLGWLVAMIFLAPLHAQTVASESSAAPASPTSASQAPDDVVKKLSELVHAGKYAEAQQTVAALLILYPDDQRLVKAKVLLDKASVTAGAPSVAPTSNPPSSNLASPQPSSNLAGMDKIDYNALIELARQAQQTTDLEQQKASLKQFMDQSSLFLQKHPNEILLWQLRAASAIGLNDPMAGYGAGQELLATGVADSDDSNLQSLLGQLKNKGWMDKEWAETTRKLAQITKTYAWMLGTWSETYTDSDWTHCSWWKDKCYKPRKGSTQYNANEDVHLSKSAPVIEVYSARDNAVPPSSPDFEIEGPSYRGTLLDSGEIRWEFSHRTWGDSGWSPWGWIPVMSCEVDEHKKTMTMVFLSWNNDKDKNASHPETHFFTKK